MKRQAVKKKPKIYPVPAEIIELFKEADAARDSQMMAIESVFFAKRAIYYGKIARDKHQKAWGLVRDLYPQLSNKDLEYREEYAGVYVREEVLA